LALPDDNGEFSSIGRVAVAQNAMALEFGFNVAVESLPPQHHDISDSVTCVSSRPIAFDSEEKATAPNVEVPGKVFGERVSSVRCRFM
jgi:hypothetical protein